MLRIVTVSVDEDQQDGVVTAEGCSEAPKGCDKCCDRLWEGPTSAQQSGPVANVEELGLVR
jgi:hypothetical protein